MATRWVRRGRRAGLGLALLMAVGCSPGTMAYFFLPENKVDPEIRKLASEDAKKEVRVAILAYSGPDAKTEVFDADQTLSDALARQLRDGCAANSERVAIVSRRKVSEFKASHPTWYQGDLHDIGRHLKADYLVYLEVERLTLRDEKSPGNMLYKGQAFVRVSLVDVNNPDEASERREFTCTYPSEANAIPMDADTPPSKFSQLFVAHVAKRLSWYFTAHLPREGYMID